VDGVLSPVPPFACPGAIGVIENNTIDGCGFEVKSAPGAFRVANYPNPFNPSTTIELSMPEASEVRITIYNILGQSVTELVNGYLPAGTHKFEWNSAKTGSRHASGIYFYRIETETFEATKKMLLMK